MEMLDEKQFPKGSIPMTLEQELNMERCAEFMARMIMKYGDKILADIEAEKAKEAAVK